MSLPAELSTSELPIDSTLTGPVLIIGSGLLGASIGLGLRAAGCEDVYVQDISPTAEAVAQDIGAGTSFSALSEQERRVRSRVEHLCASTGGGLPRRRGDGCCLGEGAAAG